MVLFVFWFGYVIMGCYMGEVFGGVGWCWGNMLMLGGIGGGNVG